MRTANNLRNAGAALAAVVVAACQGPAARGAAPPSPVAATGITLENQLPGTDAYRVTNHATQREIEGYASAVSAVEGETVDIKVNVDVPAKVRWQLFRLGYYQGHGAREIGQGGTVAVTPQPDCPPEAKTGLIECHWETAFRVAVERGWVTGYYLVKLTREDGYESLVPFVVREAVPAAPVLVQASMNTWQAYNRWGGRSLYHDAQQVSYDRPYLSDDGSGQLFRMEIWLVRWLEERGIDVAYTTNVDIDREPETLATPKLFVVSGHDEYWSLGERHALDAARDDGLSLAILSANTGYWRVRLEPSSDGVERRVVTCYKSASEPRQNHEDTTARYRDAPHARPENSLTGVLYQYGDYPYAPLPLYVEDPTHWIFANTGVKKGDRIAVALGGEWDEAADDEHQPAGVDVVLSSPAFDQAGSAATAAAAVYEPTEHSFVFAAGTEQFALGLAEPNTRDPRAERMLDNLLVRAGIDDPLALASLPPTRDTVQPGQVVVIAGSGERGHRDGDAARAEFDTPSGLALGPDGTLFVTESRNHDVRAIAPDGTVSTLAGCGPYDWRAGGFANGRGSDACFSSPNGLAVDASGTLFVADSGNHQIRAITPDGRVSTFAGGHAGNRDGERRDAEFATPFGVALGPDGSLYVIEGEGSVRRIDPEGQVTTLATDFKGATAIAVGPDGAVYVATPASGQIAIVSGDAPYVLTDARGAGGDPASRPHVSSALDALLRPSFGLVVNRDRIAFADTANDAVRELVFGSASTPSTLATVVGPTAPDQVLEGGAPAGLMLPRGIVPYGEGYAVADTGHHRIVLIHARD